MSTSLGPSLLLSAFYLSLSSAANPRLFSPPLRPIIVDGIVTVIIPAVASFDFDGRDIFAIISVDCYVCWGRHHRYCHCLCRSNCHGWIPVIVVVTGDGAASSSTAIVTLVTELFPVLSSSTSFLLLILCSFVANWRNWIKPRHRDVDHGCMDGSHALGWAKRGPTVWIQCHQCLWFHHLKNTMVFERRG